MQRGTRGGMRAASGPSLKGNVIGMESSFSSWRGSAVSALRPSAPIPSEVKTGLTDLDA